VVDFNSLSSGEPRWQRRPDARPEEILEAAKHVFGESGYAGTKLEDVARRAGVSKGTLYLYFDSKEALFREMVRAKVVAALAHAEEAVRTFDGSSRELLVILISSMYRRPHFALISQWKALEYHAINLPGSYARITDVISELSNILTGLGC